MNWVRAMVALLLVAPLLSQAATTARGRVYLDANGNGHRDWREAGMAEVKVSNGREIVRTDAKGRYRIALEDGDTLFVIKPSGYRFPLDPVSGLPQFWRHHFPKGSVALKYGRIAPSNARTAEFALLPAPDENGAAFDVLVVTDPQLKNTQELDYYARSIVAPLQGRDGLAMAMTLGDLVDNALDMHAGLNRANVVLGLPWLHAPGNHDIDFDVTDDAASLINYRRTFGPDTVAWERPGHAFIALDDVIYLPGQRPAYVGGLREDQFRFLENFLATLAPDTRVVLSFHIPLFDDPGETFRHTDRTRLFGLLARFREPLILSGHTHTQRHHFHGSESGWTGTTPLHEYNVGAGCGGYWSGLMDEQGLPDARMEDGSPNGYALLHFADEGVTMRYHASRGRDDLRIGLTSPGVIRRGAYPAIPLVANVFAAEPDARVEYRVDAGEWIPMSRSIEADPELLALNLADRQADHLRSYDRAVVAKPSQHVWRANVPTDLAVGEHRIDVRVLSRFEGEFSAHTRYRLMDWAP